MKRWLKIVLAAVAVIFVSSAILVGWYLGKAMPIGTGFAAKYLCSGTFISLRDPAIVFEQDVRPVNPLANVIRWRVDREEQSVTASAFGIFKSKAIYRQGCGATLVVGATMEELRRQEFYKQKADLVLSPGAGDAPWPADGEPTPSAFPGVNAEKLNLILDDAFSEPDPQRPRYTRAVLIVYKDRLIAERYAPGFHKGMPLLGWSMSKSVTNALVGVLVEKGLLDIHDPAPVPEWQSPDDPRHEITLDQLLRMSSGLEFEEVYEPLYDATDMLYGSYDFAAFAASKPLAAAPDSVWNYSSGTANIIARIVRQKAETQQENYYAFLRQEFFDKIGMGSAILEPDPSGTFVGSSYTFATPRDWARFGLLYLNDGLWNGERILPEGWVAYSATPTPKAPKGEYGALFWLNAGAPDDPANRLWPDAPRDAFAARGFQGQQVIIIPSRELVLVRFGATAHERDWDTNEFISRVIGALPES